MAHLSGVDLHLRYASLQWLPGARTYGERGIFPGGMRRNAEFYGQWIEFADALLQFERELLFDPQTSGGLLMALPPRDAGALVSRLQAAGEIVATIGTVTAGNGKIWVTKE
jgi:selenide,water dikinase